MKYYLMSNRPTDYGRLEHGKEYGGGMKWEAHNQYWVMDPRHDKPKKNTGGRGRGSSGGSAVPAAPVQQGPGAGDWMLAVLEAQQQARDAAYRAAAVAQRSRYDFARGQLDDHTDSALQEAYINKMLTLKSLPQQLTVQGLSGGESETTTAGVYNNYGNARSQLESERTRQLADLLNTFQTNMAKLEAERAGGAAADLAKLVPQLAKLSADNRPFAVSVTQTPADASAAAMRRLRRALGLEEEE